MGYSTYVLESLFFIGFLLLWKFKSDKIMLKAQILILGYSCFFMEQKIQGVAALWMLVKCSWMFTNVFECLRMFMNVFECLRMFSNVYECFRMFTNVFECFRIFAKKLSFFYLNDVGQKYKKKYLLHFFMIHVKEIPNL